MSSAMRELREQRRVISQSSEVVVVASVTSAELRLFGDRRRGALLE